MLLKSSLYHYPITSLEELTKMWKMAVNMATVLKVIMDEELNKSLCLLCNGEECNGV